MNQAKHTVYVTDIAEIVETSYHACQHFKRRAVSSNKSLDAFKNAIQRAEYVSTDNIEGRVLVDHRSRAAFVEDSGNLVTTYHASKV